MPPLPPTWRAVPMTQGATQEQAVARQQQLQAIYRNGQATRLAQAQNYDAYSPPVSAGNMNNGPQWRENERGELAVGHDRQVVGGAVHPLGGTELGQRLGVVAGGVGRLTRRLAGDRET